MTPESLAKCLRIDWDRSLVNTSNRNNPAVAFRWLLWTVMRCRGMSYPEIARPFGCTHQTVIHAVERVTGSPRAMVWMVRPLLESRQHTMTLAQFWEVVRYSDSPPPAETAWSLHPTWEVREVRLLACEGGDYVDSEGGRHPRSEVFFKKDAAVAEAVARASRILASVGIPLA